MKPNEELVRVLRIIEYVGPREWVEEIVARSIHGTKQLANNKCIRAATIGTYPEILEGTVEMEVTE